MIVDTSALLAIFEGEPEAASFTDSILAANPRLISGGNLLEAAMVVEGRYGERGPAELDDLVSELALDVVPFTAAQVVFARQAFRRFGKGRHSAGLNFGDCIAYALAKETGEPLLFKGNDFGQTDLTAAQ